MTQNFVKLFVVNPEINLGVTVSFKFTFLYIHSHQKYLCVMCCK